jgi:hypothetical protein
MGDKNVKVDISGLRFAEQASFRFELHYNQLCKFATICFILFFLWSKL